MKLFLLTLAMLVAATGFSQQENGSQYNSALGIKISGGWAVSYKKFVSASNALEVQGMYFNEGVRFAALYEFHFFSFPGVEGLSWYVGPGAHVGFWKAEQRVAYNSRMDVGIDGVLGLDYKIPRLPINVSLDWQPGLSVLGAGLQPEFGGVGIRYVLQ